jgi:hypothetical protein
LGLTHFAAGEVLVWAGAQLHASEIRLPHTRQTSARSGNVIDCTLDVWSLTAGNEGPIFPACLSESVGPELPSKSSEAEKLAWISAPRAKPARLPGIWSFEFAADYHEGVNAPFSPNAADFPFPAKLEPGC